jgi:Thiosulfate reductase cytochrome B subunit (membrane anchoring protein)
MASVLHPLWLRITHWLNAMAVIVMIASGWQIYNASPLFGTARFPEQLTVGGWLAGALLWHFAAMWLLAGTLLFYVVLGIASGRLRSKLWPLSLRMLAQDIRAALHGDLDHSDLGRYNMIQRIAYAAVVVDLVMLVLSGLVLWKSVQFPLLRDLMGGYDNARLVHFFAMVFLVGFIAIHVVMSLLVPRALLSMIRGV